MKRTAVLALTTFAVFAACGSDSVDPTDPVPAPLSSAVSVVRPWKSVAAGTSQLGAPCAPGGLTLVVSGGGTAAHVGRFEVVSEACYDPFTGAALGPASGVITAANGDRLDIVLTAYAEDRTTGQVSSAWSIAGGTGRFGGARGQFENSGVARPDGTWQNTGTGWIEY